MNVTFVRRLVYVLAAITGLIAATSGPASAGAFNHCEPLNTVR